MGNHAHGHSPGEFLYVPGHSRIHGLPAQVKLVAAVLTVLVFVATPGRQVWAFGVYGILVMGLIGAAGLRPRLVISRLAIEIPFLVFAALMPVLGTGPRIAVGPITLSEPGLWAAWTLSAKATLGVLVSVTLASTTSTTDLLDALRRLRVPDLLVQMLASMIRYVHVVAAESARMSRARAARGFRAGGPRSWPVLGQSLGTLFIRSYERGERVHLAMLSRGYTGSPPGLREPSVASAAAWGTGTALPVAAAIVCAVALVNSR